MIEQFRLLSINVGTIPQVAEKARESISRLDLAVVNFATNFIDRLVNATTQGASAFSGFVESVLEGLARIAAQMIVLDLVGALFGGGGGGGLGGLLSSAVSGLFGGGGGLAGGGTASLVAATGGKGGGGGVFNQTVIFNISALDGPSVAEVIRSQKGTIASVVAEAAQESTAFKRALR